MKTEDLAVLSEEIEMIAMIEGLVVPDRDLIGLKEVIEVHDKTDPSDRHGLSRASKDRSVINSIKLVVPDKTDLSVHQILSSDIKDRSMDNHVRKDSTRTDVFIRSRVTVMLITRTDVIVSLWWYKRVFLRKSKSFLRGFLGSRSPTKIANQLIALGQR